MTSQRMGQAERAPTGCIGLDFRQSGGAGYFLAWSMIRTRRSGFSIKDLKRDDRSTKSHRALD